jgi:DNA-binding NtrC family response regulator
MPSKILVIDDDAHLAQALEELLVAEGYEVRQALSAEQALDVCLREESFHLVLCDLQLPGRNGISLIRTVREACPETACVLITGHGTIRSAVTALKRGAVEYMTKPLKPKRLLALCRALLADPPAYLPNKLLATDRVETVNFDGMHAKSRAMRGVFERVRLAAGVDTTVLIVGESGTGKELVARSIHSRSLRASGPFIALHTGAIPQELIASELFGHEKGSFTGATDRKPGKFELAEGGTLFLDEISTMDDRTQVNLLRVLESFRYSRVGGRKERVANVRIVAASNRDLEAMVRAGQFREDLLYRLNIFTIRLPSLRERPEDIPILAQELLREFAQKYNKPAGSIPPETLRLLMAYSWPGNVRELRNVLEQAVLLARGAELDPLLLPQMLHREPPREEIIKISIGTTMAEIERDVILRTLEAHRGNKTATAEALGISRRSIYNKLSEYGFGPTPQELAEEEERERARLSGLDEGRHRSTDRSGDRPGERAGDRPRPLTLDHALDPMDPFGLRAHLTSACGDPR